MGTGLAILIDAPLVRGILVPAVMGILGGRSWYAPASLRRLYVRAALSDVEAEVEISRGGAPYFYPESRSPPGHPARTGQFRPQVHLPGLHVDSDEPKNLVLAAPVRYGFLFLGWTSAGPEPAAVTGCGWDAEICRCGRLLIGQ